MAKTYTFTCKKCGGETIGGRQTYEVVECFEPIEFHLTLTMSALPPAGRIDWHDAVSEDKDYGETLSTEFYCSECGEPVEEDEILIGKQEAYK